MSDNGSKRVVVLGSSFAGMTGALHLKHLLDKKHEVIVLDPRDHFTFIPSLIWVPFGTRKADDVTFKLAPMYEKKGIQFINEAAASIDTDAHTVTTSSGDTIDYDRLLVATGPRLACERIKGLGPEKGYTQSVCNLEHAEMAGKAWDEFMENPGPVVVGAEVGRPSAGEGRIVDRPHLAILARLVDRRPHVGLRAQLALGLSRRHRELAVDEPADPDARPPQVLVA